MQIDTVSKAYIAAGLRIGQDIDGFVDSYYGPTEIRAVAASFEDASHTLSLLEREMQSLRGGPRRTYFEAQLRALRTVLHAAAGDRMRYRDEVSAIYDVRPERTDESIFEEAHVALDDLLPGTGSLLPRRTAYQQQFELPVDNVLPVAERLARELRTLTTGFVNLIDGESAEIQTVTDQPWSGYNWYLGNFKSRIEINVDLPVRINSLPDLVAHEIYCGHHTEHSLKEFHLYRQHGFGEASIALLTSTQAVISEGIATTAFELLVPERDRAAWLQEACYRPAGINIDVETDLAISKASKALRYVDGNAAFMIHEDGCSEEEAIDYIVRYGLRDQASARQTVKFITTPILRTYVFTYTTGYDLVMEFLDQASDRYLAFQSLLTEHWTPAMLDRYGESASESEAPHR